LNSKIAKNGTAHNTGLINKESLWNLVSLWNSVSGEPDEPDIYGFQMFTLWWDSLLRALKRNT
jgi:hypothetical protein